MQLPPPTLDGPTLDAWLEQVAEHVAEFARTGYEVALLDDGALTARLEAQLAALGADPLPPYRPPDSS